MTPSIGPVASITELSSETQLAFVNLWNDFWSQVVITDSPDDCWLWKGEKLSNGYGSFKHAGISVHAYRIAWMLTHPDAPTGNGLCLRHRCGNRPCCNPNHLSRGTTKENAQDRTTHGTQTRGSTHHNSIFTEEQVYAILCDHADGVPATILAERHGVGYDTIWQILTRKQWLHVPLPANWKGYKSSWELKATRTPLGSAVRTSRYTEEQVYQMRVDFLNGATAASLGRKYGGEVSCIVYAIKKGWQHVPYPPGWDDYKAISKRNVLAAIAKFHNG